jgi:hypothetical protein
LENLKSQKKTKEVYEISRKNSYIFDGSEIRQSKKKGKNVDIQMVEDDEEREENKENFIDIR